MRFIIIILLIGAAIVIFFGKTQSYFKDITALNSQKSDVEEALANSRQLQQMRDNLLSQYNSISQDDIGKLYKMLPEQVDHGNLIVMFEDRVKNHNLLLKKIDVKDVTQASESSSFIGAPASLYKIIGISFTVSGSYSSFLRFLADLEKDLRIIDVNAISFSSGTSDIYEFSVSGQAYSAVLSQQAGVNIGEGGDKDAQEILSLLAKLKSLKIDTDFFQGEIFKSFVEFLPSIELPKEHGRINPFSSSGK